MQRKWGVLFFCILAGATTGYAQDTSVNVNAYTIPELPSVPVIDGDLSDAVWGSVPTIPMDKDGDSPAAEPGTGDLDIVLKIAWDDETNALYFAINVIDESFVNVLGLGSTAGSGGYNNERLEIIIDGSNSGDSASSTTSGFHQQYTMDIQNNWDPFDPEALYYGGFDQEGGIPVSTEFVPVLVYERIEGTLNLAEAHYPFNIADEYFESAAMIRVTDPAVTEWMEAPVEINWEVKIVPFEFLDVEAVQFYDLDDPTMIETGWLAFWEDEFNTPLDLEEGHVIGCSPQQNDGDIFAQSPTREHQTNTTGYDGNWDSSENLTGLILGPAAVSVSDWSIH